MGIQAIRRALTLRKLESDEKVDAVQPGNPETSASPQAAVTPVDPAGPDRYRGGAKPWESYAPPLRGVADG